LKTRSSAESDSASTGNLKSSLGHRRPVSELGERGARRIEWARAHMPVLDAIREELKRKKTLRGLRIGMALHVEAKTGVLALSLQEAGAKVRLASCNPLSTDDSVATALAEVYHLEVYAKKWETMDEYYANLNQVLDLKPDLVIDDGADIVSILHTKRTDLLPGVRGGNEETTTGIIRLRAMERDGALRFPIINVNDAQMKHLFDNRYGTGQSTIDGVMNATNLLIAGKTFVVAGYGWTGRGIALRARGMGARVIVTEVDPVKAIEASMDGFEVMPMRKASRIADFIVSATGCKDIVTAVHFPGLKDQVVLANAGHFDNEISKADLERVAKGKKKVREFVDEYVLPNGKRIHLLAEGRLVNIAAGQGHPVEIMDMSFAIQAVSAGYLAEHAGSLKPRLYPVPESLDLKVARLKLQSSGIRTDRLTKGQREYLGSWREGS
jgi:adenosylhomocysteinase